MKVNDYDIKIDEPQFLDKESVQRWVDKAIDIKDLIRDFEKFTSKEYRLSLLIAFGFIEWPNEGEVVVIQDRTLFHHDKQVILMVAGSRAHKAIVANEQKYDIHFERIDEETINKIYSKTFYRFTDEDGKRIGIAMRPLCDFPPMMVGELARTQNGKDAVLARVKEAEPTDIVTSFTMAILRDEEKSNK